MSYGTPEWNRQQIIAAGGTPPTPGQNSFATALSGLQTLGTQSAGATRTASPAQVQIAENTQTAGYDWSPTINGLFQEYLGRDAKNEGLAYWGERLASGSPMDLVAYEIRNSEEAKKRNAATQDAPAAPAPTPQSVNVPLYQSAPTPTYTPYQSSQFQFEADPGYAFRQSEGQKAIQSKQLASGNFFSGGALKEATDFNSGLASQEYGNAFNRYLANDSQRYNQHIGNYNAQLGNWGAADAAGYRNNNAAYDRQWNADQRDYARWSDDYNRRTTADNTNWSRLQYLDQTGLSAAGAGVSAGQNSAGNIGNLLLNGGAAQAGGAINSNNAWINAIGNALYGLR